MAAPALKENVFTHSGDKKTFYWSAGPANGPLVILIHGWPANGETWTSQLLALASLGFHAVAPDTRGYGRSSVPSSTADYAVEHHVSDMLALLSHVGRTKALWIGHDWGAGLVWAFASVHPDKCVGVVGMAVPYLMLELGIEGCAALSNREIYPVDEYPYAQWEYQVFHKEKPKESAALLHQNTRSTVKIMFRGGSPAENGKPSVFGKLNRLGGWWGGLPEAPDVPLETTLWKGREEAFERMVGEFERNGFEGPNAYYLNYEANKKFVSNTPNGGKLLYPVLFIAGRWDSVCDTISSRLAEPMRENCQDLTETIIDAGHWIGLEKPEETNAAIVRWIATKLPDYFPGHWTTPFASKA